MSDEGPSQEFIRRKQRLVSSSDVLNRLRGKGRSSMNEWMDSWRPAKTTDNAVVESSNGAFGPDGSASF